MHFKVIFAAALILTVVSFGLDYALVFILQPLEVSNLTGGGNPFELFNLVLTFVLFVFNPVVSFVIFYKLGSRISVQTNSDHYRILEGSFGGGFAGYAIGYLGFSIYEAIATGGAPLGPNTDWFLWSAQVILELVRGGISMAFLAFAGVMVGALRSAVPGAAATTTESGIPAPGAGNSS